MNEIKKSSTDSLIEEGGSPTLIEKPNTQTADKEKEEMEREIQEAVDKLVVPQKEEKTEIEKETEIKKEIEEVAENLSLEEINELTGREFKSKSEFAKHYKNLASFSGSDEAQELRRKAKEYDSMIEDAKKVEELTNKEENKVEKPQIELTEIKEKQIAVNEEIQELRNRLEDEKFSKNYPDAVQYLDMIKIAANKVGKGINEFYSGSEIESLVKDRVALEGIRKQEKDYGVHSRSRISSPENRVVQRIRELKEIQRGDGKQRDIAEAELKLVEEQLGISLENQK